jgi:hypothetical protein
MVLFRLVLWHESSVKRTFMPCGWSYCYYTRFTITFRRRGWSYCYCTGFTITVRWRGWSYCYCTRFTITVRHGWSYWYSSGLTTKFTNDRTNVWFTKFVFKFTISSSDQFSRLIPLFSLDAASVLNRIPTFRCNIVSLSSRFDAWTYGDSIR